MISKLICYWSELIRVSQEDKIESDSPNKKKNLSLQTIANNNNNK